VWIGKRTWLQFYYPSSIFYQKFQRLRCSVLQIYHTSVVSAGSHWKLSSWTLLMAESARWCGLRRSSAGRDGSQVNGCVCVLASRRLCSTVNDGPVRYSPLHHFVSQICLRRRAARAPPRAFRRPAEISRTELVLLTCSVRRTSSWHACSLACCCGTCSEHTPLRYSVVECRGNSSFHHLPNSDIIC